MVNPSGVRLRHGLPDDAPVALLFEASGLELLLHRAEPGVNGLGFGGRRVRRHESFADQLRDVFLADRRRVLDRLVHQRLGVGRLVALVVPMPPVAD